MDPTGSPWRMLSISMAEQLPGGGGARRAPAGVSHPGFSSAKATLVGYEAADTLDAVRTGGFTTVGPLRVWIHGV